MSFLELVLDSLYYQRTLQKHIIQYFIILQLEHYAELFKGALSFPPSLRDWKYFYFKNIYISYS